MVGDESKTTPWAMARERLANPENPRTSWLATTHPDGRCVVGMSSTRLPSIDLVIEGRAAPLTEHSAVRRVAEVLSAGGWPLEAKGDKVYGPNAPTAGSPPYTIFRIVPSRAYGLPGMFGMEQFDQADLPRPTRWDFDEGPS